jgi:hypothetical protein
MITGGSSAASAACEFRRRHGLREQAREQDQLGVGRCGTPQLVGGRSGFDDPGVDACQPEPGSRYFIADVDDLCHGQPSRLRTRMATIKP